MQKIIVVGSGASGVHFALTALERGHHVTLIDAGQARPPVSNLGDSFSDLKEKLADPVHYFLGETFETVVYPGSRREYYTKPYAFPPSKNDVFALPADFDVAAQGFEPLFSFAQGGLAEAWTGGVYPFNDAELEAFPLSYAELEPWYSRVAERIGICAQDDDLARFFPLHGNVIPPLRLDENSQQLVQSYQKHRAYITQRLKTYLGRSRVATLSSDKGDRKACSYCGRCLWGCPNQSLYTPSATLNACRQYAQFEYVPETFASHFTYNASHQVTALIAQTRGDAAPRAFVGDAYVLAAGTLCSSKIFMDSIWRQTGEIVKLTGLMDNRQILVPFVNLKFLGARYNPVNYQYHQLALGIETPNPAEYVHGQITTLKTALLHPIIYNVPVDLAASLSIFRNLRAALGVVNLNLHDWRRAENYLTLQPQDGGERTRLVIQYSAPSNEPERIKQMVGIVKKVLWRLGCLVPPSMVHVRPMGSSVHYAGTLPMTTARAPLTASKNCASHDFENLFLVDGATFPFLPAKNISFTLMANAARVAHAM
jgi:choline dehydrogenase-like flavoprotein